MQHIIAYTGALTFTFFVGWFCLGCGGPPAAAQDAITLTARVLLEADQVAARGYTAASERALNEAQTLPDYRVRMQAWDEMVAYLGVARSAVLATQNAYDAWEGGGDANGFARTVPCLLAAIVNINNALRDVGLEVPDTIGDAIRLLSSFAGECTDG